MWAGSIACVFVVVWLMATVLNQISRFQAWLARRDPYNLLPSWAFFAPNPGYHDYHLLARELRRNGSLGPCIAITELPERRHWHAIWNPAKRSQRALQDAMQAVKRLRRWSKANAVVQSSLPYLLLLHYVLTEYPASSDATALQFIVVETTGREGKRVWISFVSGFHRLSPRSVRGSSKPV